MPDFSGFSQIAPARVKIYHVNKNDSFSTSSTSFVDVTGLSLTISPNSPASKFLVRACIQCGYNYTANYTDSILVRNGAFITQGDISGGKDGIGTRAYGYDSSTLACSSLEVLDSPGGAATPLIYKVQIKCFGAGVAYVNRDHNNNVRAFSALTVMEICL